jgi:hypothetical protein
MESDSGRKLPARRGFQHNWSFVMQGGWTGLAPAS